MIAKKGKAPSPIAEILRRLAEQGVEEIREAAGRCAGPLGEAAIDVIAQAAQERYGLGFVPGVTRLKVVDAQMLLAHALSTNAPLHTPQRRTEPRRAETAVPSQQQRGRKKGMPFAADFSGTADRRQQATRAQKAESQQRANEHRRTKKPFGDWMPEDAPPRQDPETAEVAAAYATMGLLFGAPLDATKQRRHDLALQIHSDRHGHTDEQRRAADQHLGKINAAVDVIKNWLAKR